MKTLRVANYIQSHLEIVATTRSEPVVSSCLAPEPWLILFPYALWLKSLQQSQTPTTVNEREVSNLLTLGPRLVPFTNLSELAYESLEKLLF